MAEYQWNALTVPNFAATAINAYDAGRDAFRQDAARAAYAKYATDPKAAIRELTAYDPKAAVELGKVHREEQQDEAAGRAAGLAAKGDYAGGVAEALKGRAYQAATAIGQMDTAARARAKDNAEHNAKVILGAQGKPYEERRAYLETKKPDLLAHGWTEEQFNAYDPKDDNLAADVFMGQTIDSIIAGRHWEQDFSQRLKAFTETQNQNAWTRQHGDRQLDMQDGQNAFTRAIQTARLRVSQSSAAESARHNRQVEARATGGKPLPVGLQKSEDADIEAIQLADNINGQLDTALGRLNDGTIKLGPVANTVSGVMNFTGNSNQTSRNYAEFKATLEKMRNDSLRLNKGVQTEGDAQRAWNELFTNLNDPGVVKQRLATIRGLNEKAMAARANLINVRRSRNGVQPLDPSELGVALPSAAAPRQGAPAPNRGAAAPAAGPPAAAVNYLRSNPGMAAQFDAKYGAGAAKRYLGGR